MTSSLGLSGDLSRTSVAVGCVLALLALAMLGVELFRGSRRTKGTWLIGLSGVLGVLALLAAILRPVRVSSRATFVGPRVAVLLDASRSIDLPGYEGTRRATLEHVLGELRKRRGDLREALFAFGSGPPTPFAVDADGPEAAKFAVKPLSHSDLGAALESLAKAADERPLAIVVVSDGRLDRPAAEGTEAMTRTALGVLDVPVHTVALASSAPPDASIRSVKTAGAAVAHQPFSLRVEIGCDGGLSCGSIPVAAREYREHGPPTTLAAGTANVEAGSGIVELSLTLDRAGPRILEVEITAPKGDAVPANDKRFVSIDVARERVRVLHVAGRPTYDVRALRMWLKSDASVDVVAFFILRTPTDNVMASQDELALIPFPVDELFSEHLPSFDAVVLQDFNAQPYGLAKHLKSLARYVDKGGGLIMVGGPDAFVPGHYAGTPLADVLPVALPVEEADGVDLGSFVPRLTEAGRSAPALRPLRALLGDDWPEMSGANLVGDARSGTTVLLEHPTRKTKSGAPMPLLALGEHESGRTIALALDGSHRLSFSAFAANAAGRGHGAFWDAMLGWLMRDPRFEPAVVDLPETCIAGEETTLVLHPAVEASGEARLVVSRLGSGEVVRTVSADLPASADRVPVDVGRLDAGGYSVSVEIRRNGVQYPATKRDFACEQGGDEWADTRPDVERLERIAKATGGRSVRASEVASLPFPAATQVTTERKSSPILPPWAWTLSAAVLLGAHWFRRRASGLP